MEKTAQGEYDAEKAIRLCQTRNIREITLILYNLCNGWTDKSHLRA